MPFASFFSLPEVAHPPDTFQPSARRLNGSRALFDADSRNMDPGPYQLPRRNVEVYDSNGETVLAGMFLSYFGVAWLYLHGLEASGSTVLSNGTSFIDT